MSEGHQREQRVGVGGDLRARAIAVAMALLLLLAALFPGLGASGLLDPWEMDRAAVARPIAAHPKVVVIDRSGALLTHLDGELGGSYALERLGGHANPSARVALQRAPSELRQQIVHALVIDMEAVMDGRRGGRLDPVVTQLDRLISDNRGVVLIAVARAQVQETLRQRLAQAHARLNAEAFKGGWWRFGQGTSAHPEVLSPLFMDDYFWVSPEEAAQAVRDHCPSPWLRTQHKIDGRIVQTPWLDTVLMAASLSILGLSEFAARLPGALIALFSGLFLFFASRKIWGNTTAWMTLVVFVTLPMTLGAGRVLTLQESGLLGLTLVVFGFALGVQGRSRFWGLWYALGLLVLLLGQGLAGLTIGALIGFTYALVTVERRWSVWLAAAGGLGALALMAWLVLGIDAGPLLRGWRFTQVPFRGDLPTGHTGFGWMVGQLGFALYPWGGLLLLGAGRLVVAPRVEDGADEAVVREHGELTGAGERMRLLLALGLGVPLLGWMAMLRNFHHPVLPLASVVALTVGLLLREVARGRLSGGVAALFVILPALLLHREIGKHASVMVRWLTYDPPFRGERAIYTWPKELIFNRGLRAAVLLAVVAFGLGLARPVSAARGLFSRLQAPRAAAWSMALVAIIWALDAVISLGTRLDVLLRAEASRTGYAYDRVWTTIQGTRPEVIAGAFLFGLLLLTVALIVWGRGRGWAQRRLVRLAASLSGLFRSAPIALGSAGAAAIGVLMAGLIVWVDVRHLSWGEALVAGLSSAPFLIPLLLAALVGMVSFAVRRAAGRLPCLSVEGEGPRPWLLSAIIAKPTFSIALLSLVAVAGIGVGASQQAGTWSYGFLVACWALASALGLTIAGRSGSDLRGYAAGLLAVALVVWGGIFSALAARFLIADESPWRYLRHDLLTSPDALLWLLIFVALGLNRLARERPVLKLLRAAFLSVASLIERPRWGVGLLMGAAFLMSMGYTHSLLPGLSLQFSQKHILTRVAEVGGAGEDEHGLPRTFKYVAGGRDAVGRNFYTQTMPTISDQRTLIELLSGRNVAMRVTDWGPKGKSAKLAMPGWSATNDADEDGRRDAEAWFGLAESAEGVRVKAAPTRAGEGSRWTKDQWKGATLYGSGGEVAVLGNDEDTLTLARPTLLVPEDMSRGAFSLDLLKREGATAQASAMSFEQRFVVLPRTAFSGLNHAFRLANGGRQMSVLDARSSRLVLVTNRLPEGLSNQNWIDEVVLSEEALAELPHLHRISVDFDGKLELVAWRLKNEAVARTQKYELEIFFRVHEPVKRSYMLFMHPHPLHRDFWPIDWHTGGAKDAKRCTGCFQTDHWLKGDIVRFPITQEVPLGTNSGPQDIILGLYDPLTDKRLPIKGVSGAGVVKHGDNRVTIARLQVR